MRGRDGVVGVEAGLVEQEPPAFTCTLRPDYTFANFVVGASNQRAYQLARRIAGATEHSRASLYLHGGVGVGKTHLAMAVAHAVRARHGEHAVLVVSAARLAECWQDAGAAQATDAALRAAELLIVDDVQFLVGGERGREALQRQVDRLRALGNRLVLTCDLPPSETPELGLLLGDDATPANAAEIAPPDPTLRREILVAKAARLGSALASDVVAFIAEIAPLSVRALEGALHRALEFAATLRVPLSVAVAERALAAWRRPAPPPPSLDAIADAVAIALGVPRRQIRQAARRDRTTVLARQVAIYLARRLTGLPLATIAADYGCREHSVAAHAFATIKKRLERDPALGEVVARLERELGEPVRLAARVG